uniref:Biotin and thiamin synthesis-associated domain-containing protein n=1 Tax=Chlamydomonas euryale TaxID=1486919 RepID=A0A7R9V5U9_9CHLO|mmetsp:Transcript_20294/g.60283  ORF Transcript_20294/g.60283 Transcript_20294/m.60283 type:complete len:567 (+) Transcript_20294:433-2133(+)
MSLLPFMSAAAAAAARPALLGAALGHAGRRVLAAACGALPDGLSSQVQTRRPRAPALGQQIRGMLWSVEREKGHTYRDPSDIINEKAIFEAMERTKAAAKDEAAVAEILQNAKDRSFLTNYTPGKSEYVQGLTLDECATLLNVDAGDAKLMERIYDTAFAIKNRIYGNRIVLFAPLYIANYCVNSCTYCAFRGANKKLQRSALTDEELRDEVASLERQGHRRLLVLTGEHPKYTFEQFLHAIEVIGDTRSEPCGSIRRINVEIPTLSVSDMRRLKATDKIGTFTLFQETYHRDTFRKMHVSGPKSDYNHRLLTQDRAMRAGLDDVGIGTLFGLFDYRFEVLAMLQHSEHLEKEYGAGPHTISVPRMRPADGSELSSAPPHVVDDANFKKLVAIIRIAVPYTGMILSTRESPQMRAELLKVGMSQMSAGSKTDVGAYHRDDSKTTEEELGKLAGQFSLMDHRATPDVVKDLMLEGYVPSWCTACYRKGRTGEHFMKIAKAGNIHSFCHPNSILSLQEYLQDYGTEEMKQIGKDVVAREMESGLTDSAKRLLARKMVKVEKGDHDVYI